MNLAVIFLLSLWLNPLPRLQIGWWSEQSTPSATAAPTSAPQGASDSKQTPAAPSTKAAAGQKHPVAKKTIHKKKVTVSCDPAPASSASGSNSAPAQPGQTAGGTPSPQSGTPASSQNCPPAKIVVRQGGMAEPSIQLAGGAGGGDAAQKRDATNQMLGVTEENLKKVTAQQLNPNQQDSVTQIRQFMEQSKNAIAAGDMDRARTLAWKAQLLSEDLVKPQPQ